MIHDLGLERELLDRILKQLGIPDVKRLDEYNVILLTSALLGEVTLNRRQDRVFNERMGAAYDVSVKYLLTHKPLDKPPCDEVLGLMG
jgi:hypothetical protein